MMDAIFGREDQNHSELFSPQNGLLMLDLTEQKFDKGYFVIVPRVSDRASAQEISDWHASYPKEYKIRVVNPEGSGMDDAIYPHLSNTFNDLDGQQLNFRSDHRPRARYLYFHYCATMLRRSWFTKKPASALRDELGKRFWGTPGGRYMNRNMLMAFVEDMGHEYEELLEGAMEQTEEDKQEGPVETALAAASDHIKVSLGKGPERFSYGIDESDDKEEEDITKGGGLLNRRFKQTHCISLCSASLKIFFFVLLLSHQ